ncbi:hypothetical protein L596_002892 [Steinernema carpocapsae]|uniref:Uncharacterized protein n=1 Tax=Steinernema carpocapsae TaxID=34508 RepID=A0A4U8UR03_STECR|nr:hypothetical protein L596_002892 [Steinernema carpocapsae]
MSHFKPTICQRKRRSHQQTFASFTHSFLGECWRVEGIRFFRVYFLRAMFFLTNRLLCFELACTHTYPVFFLKWAQYLPVPTQQVERLLSKEPQKLRC